MFGTNALSTTGKAYYRVKAFSLDKNVHIKDSVLGPFPLSSVLFFCISFERIMTILLYTNFPCLSLLLQLRTWVSIPPLRSMVLAPVVPVREKGVLQLGLAQDPI